MRSRMADGIVARMASMKARNMSSLERSGCSTQKRPKCQVTPAGMNRWQSYSTPILVEGMTTPIRPRWPIHGSCGLASLACWSIANTCHPQSSIHAHAARLDRAGPFLDLALDELLQVLGRPALGRGHARAQLLEPLLHERRFHRCDGGIVKFADDRRGRSFRQEEGVPGPGFEIGQPLFLRGCQSRQHGRAVARE